MFGQSLIVLSLVSTLQLLFGPFNKATNVMRHRRGVDVRISSFEISPYSIIKDGELWKSIDPDSSQFQAYLEKTT